MQKYNKAIVALIMAVIGVVNLFWVLPIPVDEASISTVLTVLTPVLVYFIPNKK